MPLSLDTTPIPPSSYNGGKWEGTASSGLQLPLSGRRDWRRDLNCHIILRIKHLRQIDHGVNARSRGFLNLSDKGCRSITGS